MQKVILFFMFLGIVACNTEPNAVEKVSSDKLSTDLVNNPNSLQGDNSSNEETGKLVFTDTIHDFGKMKEGEMIQYEFAYKNIGSKPVIITDAVGSCGCTVPRFDREPVGPGEERTMEVTFNSKGKPGYNEKHVNISTNATPAQYRLTILAEVK